MGALTNGYYIEVVPCCFTVKLLVGTNNYEKVSYRPEKQYWSKVNQVKLNKKKGD